MKELRDSVFNSPRRDPDMGYALCRRPPIIAHWFRTADSWHSCKRILATSLVPRPVIWHAWWLNSGDTGAQQRTSLLPRHITWLLAWWLNFSVPWNLGTILGHSKGHFEVHARISLYFCWILGSHFENFSRTLDQNKCVCLCLSPGFCSGDFWVRIWMSGIGKTSIWQGRYCKNHLSRKLDFS